MDPGDGLIPWHSLELTVVFQRLQSSAAGLDPGEAARRLASFGSNQLAAARTVSPWSVFLQQSKTSSSSS